VQHQQARSSAGDNGSGWTLIDEPASDPAVAVVWLRSLVETELKSQTRLRVVELQ
jgi:hypothetical protein